MKLAIMQPYFFPYIGYWQLFHAVDRIILYADLPFSTRTWVSRNRLRHPNGGEFFINAPVTGHGARMIREVQLRPLADWKDGFIRTLRLNYGCAPFYEETMALLVRIILSDTPATLFSMNALMIRAVARHLEISTEIEARPNAFEDVEMHVRSLPKEERMTRRIAEICRANHAETYINPIGGKQLYNRERFLTEGISIRFVSTGDCTYSQRSYDFLPNLSILDILMHCGKAGAQALLAKYELI